MPLPFGFFAVFGILSWIGYLVVDGIRKKVFISYHSKGDCRYKNLIVAWAKNERFKLNFEDLSTEYWVLWEIEKAKELKKPIIAIKLRKNFQSPKSLMGCGTKWIIGFSEEKIRKALKEVSF